MSDIGQAVENVIAAVQKGGVGPVRIDIRIHVEPPDEERSPADMVEDMDLPPTMRRPER